MVDNNLDSQMPVANSKDRGQSSTECAQDIGTVRKSKIIYRPWNNAEVWLGSPQKSKIIYKAKNNADALINVDARNFEQLANGGKAFADKSMFIYDLIRNESCTIRLTLPQGMGKTMLLTMAKSFFEISPGTADQAYYNMPNFKLFAGCEILKAKNFVATYFGKVPIIYLSLRGVGAETLEGVLDNFRAALASTCKEFAHLLSDYNVRLKQKKTKLSERHQYEFLAEAIGGGKQLDERALWGSVSQLSSLLHNKYGTNVIVLLDEYDDPFNFLGQHMDISRAQKSGITNFFASFFDVSLEGNFDVKTGVVAGVMPVDTSWSGCWSHVTFCERNMQMGGQLSQYFGFNQLEVDAFVKVIRTKLNRTVPQHHLDMAKCWYSGHCAMVKWEKVHLYNPRSMSKFLNLYTNNIRGGRTPELKDTLCCYLIMDNNPYINYLHGILNSKRIAPMMLSYLNGATGLLVPVLPFGTTEFKLLAEARVSIKGVKWFGHLEESLLSILYYNGFLSIEERRIKVPNNETRNFMRKQLLDYLENHFSFKPKFADNVIIELSKIASSEEMDFGNVKLNGLKPLKKAIRQFLGKVPKAKFRLDEASFKHAMLSYLAIRMDGVVELAQECVFQTPAEDAKLPRLDLAYHLEGTTVIVQMNCGGKNSEKIATEFEFQEALKHRRNSFALKQFAYIRRFVLIGIHVDTNWWRHRPKVTVRCHRIVEEGGTAAEQPEVPAEAMQTPKKLDVIEEE